MTEMKENSHTYEIDINLDHLAGDHLWRIEKAIIEWNSSRIRTELSISDQFGTYSTFFYFDDLATVIRFSRMRRLDQIVFISSHLPFDELNSEYEKAFRERLLSCRGESVTEDNELEDLLEEAKAFLKEEKEKWGLNSGPKKGKKHMKENEIAIRFSKNCIVREFDYKDGEKTTAMAIIALPDEIRDDSRPARTFLWEKSLIHEDTKKSWMRYTYAAKDRQICVQRNSYDRETKRSQTLSEEYLSAEQISDIFYQERVRKAAEKSELFRPDNAAERSQETKDAGKGI